MRDTFKSLAFIAGAILFCLFAGCVSSAYATIPIALATPGGVCQFQATKVTAVANMFAAEGAWGPGCPGYVATTLPVGAVDCSKVVPPLGLTRLTHATVSGANLDVTKFESVYGMFPGKVGVKTFTIPRGSYIALEFTVPPAIAANTIGKLSNLSTGTSAPFSETISECLGDLRGVAEQAKGCGLSVNSEGNQPYVINYVGGFRCNLIAGRRYFLHILHAPLGAAGSSTCNANACTATVKNAPRQ